MPMNFEDESKLAVRDQAIEKTSASKPASTRKSGSKRNDKVAQSGITDQAKAVDDRIQSTREAIAEVNSFIDYKATETAIEFAQVLVDAPDRFFALVNEKVSEVEIDNTQFDEFNASIKNLLAGMKNARAQTQP